jgi:hypothetical protein
MERVRLTLVNGDEIIRKFKTGVTAKSVVAEMREEFKEWDVFEFYFDGDWISAFTYDTREDIQVKFSSFDDKDNIGQCECGNYAHRDYLTYDNEGSASCPTCQMDYMGEQIVKMKELVKEIADPKLSHEDIKNMILDKYRQIYGLSSLDDMDFLEG